MEKIEKQRRLLGAQEILFYAMNEASPKHFLLAAEIEGTTTVTDWHRAVTACRKAHPMLNRSILADGDNLVFLEGNDHPSLLQTAPLPQLLNLKEAIAAELEIGFQSDKGPLARIKLFYSEQKCVIIIAAHHSIADALSSVNLLNDLLGILSGKNKSLPPFSPQLSVDEFLGLDNQGLAVKINKQIRPGTPLPHEFLKQHPPAKVDIVHFSKELMDKLATFAKKQATSVHGALQAAAALSLRELAFETQRPAYIMSPFSVRKEMNVGTEFGLFIDTKIVAVATNQNIDFWDIARSAAQGLSDVHSPEFLQASAAQLRGLITDSDDLIQFIKDHFNFDIMLSNLGRLSLDNTPPELKINYVAGPFIISGLNQQQAIGAATYNGQLTLTNSSRYLVTGLLDRIRAKIEAACAG